MLHDVNVAMPPRSAIVIVTGLLLAACSGGAAPAVQTAQPTRAVAPTAAAAPPASPTSLPAPTTATTAAPTPTSAVATPAPTFAGPVDLEALIPGEIGGMTLTKQSMTAAEAFPSGDFQQAFAALLTTLGTTPDVVSVVGGQGSSGDGEIVVVQAYRIAGADADALLNGLVEVFRQFETDESVATPTTIGGKEVIVLGETTTEAQYKSYFYGYGDIVFRFGYNGANFDERAAEIVSRLP